MWNSAIIKATSNFFWCVGENKLHFPVFRKPVVCTDEEGEMINSEQQVNNTVMLICYFNVKSSTSHYL